jgi:ribonucleoside-diphosphate reductase alpha chain
MGRMTSLALRSGVEAQEIVTQMRGISCHLPVGYGAVKVSSCADAMAKAMEWYLGLKRSIEGSLGSSAISPQALGAEVRAREDMRSATGVLKNTAIAPSQASMQLTTHSAEISFRGACPDCGGTVEHADGCVVCRGCGYTECG